MGEIKASLTLPKNSFKYNENIYFIMEIDCTKLTIEITSVKISINVNLKTNNNTTPGKNDNNTKPIEINMKKIEVKKGQKNYYIDDFIKLADNSYNPETIYKKYDSKKKLKFDNDFFLYQSCYEQALNCQYSIRAMIEINSMFSTNEFVEIPIDFYADDNNDINPNTTNEDKNINSKDNNITNEEDEVPSLEEIIKGKQENEKKLYNNGYYNINYVDNEQYFNNNNEQGNEVNDNDADNSGAPPSSGQFV